eukprot:sb/3467534/
MYLSLVQVFGSHISKYMLKFNLAAWLIPIPFPLIGYFVFTNSYTVGEGEQAISLTDHNYMAETMCFIKPETIAFYTLFLTPLCLCIIINLVFFALVAKVIKNSKSSGNISDNEQMLRQLKAAVGVMVLLGTGWFIGIFMSVPVPEFQVYMQYLFIILNSTQGTFVFLFYIVLNDQVKTHWMVKFGFAEAKKTTTSSSRSRPRRKRTYTRTRQLTYQGADQEDHTYSTAEYANNLGGKHEFPVKSSATSPLHFQGTFVLLIVLNDQDTLDGEVRPSISSRTMRTFECYAIVQFS